MSKADRADLPPRRGGTDARRGAEGQKGGSPAGLRGRSLPWNLIYTAFGIGKKKAAEEAAAMPQPDTEAARNRLETHRARQAFWLWMILALLLCFTVALGASRFGRRLNAEADIQRSTRARSPLEQGAVRETAYFTDDLGWIRSGRKLRKGMEYFYENTGVQPYLFLTENVNGVLNPVHSDFETYAAALYKRLFTDQGHLLLIVYSNKNHLYDYSSFLYCGTAAAGLMDEEAQEILLDYLDALFADGRRYPERARDKMFSDVFRNAAERIMSVRSAAPWRVTLVLVLALVMLVAVLDFRKAYRAQKKAEPVQIRPSADAPLFSLTRRPKAETPAQPEQNYHRDQEEPIT